MATVLEILVSTLQADAQLFSVGSLGALLGHQAVAPYGIFFAGPPSAPIFPLVTWYPTGSMGKMPRSTYLTFTAWGHQYDLVLDRIYQLLNNKASLFVAATDFHIVECAWSWGGPEVEDPSYEIYTQSHRYVFRGVKL